jgi:lipopolysaccharide transport system ATP-binding protein
VTTAQAAVTPSLASDVVIDVRRVSKKFTRDLRRSMALGLADLGRNLVGRPLPRRLRDGEFWALEDVSLQLRRGERLGIVGLNGSGKTTLMRVIAGIFPPDRGEVAVRGRLTALIAVGAGFHPHLTGRENVYLNGELLGMTRSEIDDRFDDIVAFAEVGEFLDAPVAVYSSGMRIRLGFAVSTAVDPDVLLLDEVFAVGDLAFRQRCFRRIEELATRAGIILVSHQPGHVQNLCERAVWLYQGRVEADGPVGDVLTKYNLHIRAVHETFMAQRGRSAEMAVLSDHNLRFDDDPDLDS